MHLLRLHVHLVGCSKLTMVMGLRCLLLRLRRLLCLLLHLLLRGLLLLLAPLILLLLPLTSLSVDLLMTFLQLLLSLYPLHILVLNRVNGRSPELQLRQYTHALWLRHPTVLGLELVECVASQPQNTTRHACNLHCRRRLGIGLGALIC